MKQEAGMMRLKQRTKLEMDNRLLRLRVKVLELGVLRQRDGADGEAMRPQQEDVAVTGNVVLLRRHRHQH